MIPIMINKKIINISNLDQKIPNQRLRRKVRALAQSLAGLGAKAFNWFQFPGLGAERYHEMEIKKKKDVFLYRRKILIINVSMIIVAFLLIKFLSLFFELIVRIAFCFLEIGL